MSIIPRQLKLAGLTIDVVLDNTLFKEKGIVGEARYPAEQILIDNSVQKLTSVEHNYCHELVHWIFYVLNEEELRGNEKLVDQIAYLLHQALTTSKEHYGDDFIRNIVKPEEANGR